MARINDTTDYVVTAPADADNLIGTDVSNTTNHASGETANFNARAVANLSIPTGGTTGQALLKASGTDHDLEWGDVATPPAGPGFVERTYTETIEVAGGETELTFSTLPSNLVGPIIVSCNGISLSGSGHFLLQIGTGGVATTTGYTSTGVAVTSGNFSTGGTSSSGYYIFGGSSGNELTGSVTLDEVGDDAWVASHVGRNSGTGTTLGGGSATLAGPLDFVRLSRTSGTFDAGTVKITYTVLEALTGVEKLTFTTSTTMTLAQAPAMVAADHAGAATHTLPPAAPAGTEVKFVQAGAGATRIEAPSGETMDGVTGGGATLTGQYAECTCTKYSFGWVISGDVGAVS